MATVFQESVVEASRVNSTRFSFILLKKAAWGVYFSMVYIHVVSFHNADVSPDLLR